MNEKFTVRRANENDIPDLQKLIKGLAEYEKRPQDMTASQKDLGYWIFERKVAAALIAEYNNEIIGYAIYYPVFGSFAAEMGVHLEDFFLCEKYRHCGFGKIFFSRIQEFVKLDGYSKMEWSCLEWNTPSIGFYNKIGATQELGRKYFLFDCK
mgnify:CR=1 FL=1